MREREQRKIAFQGTIKSVQPRSNVWRYRLDNCNHSITGYNLFLAGTAEDEEREFAIAISEKQQEEYKFHIGDEIKGTGWTKKYPEWEYADYYRTGALKKLQENNVVPIKDGTPWISEVPELSVYDWRGCRMLDKKCWSGNVSSVNGHVWPMSPLNITGELLRSIGSNPFVMGRRIVSIIRWESQEQFHIRVVVALMMKAG